MCSFQNILLLNDMSVVLDSTLIIHKKVTDWQLRCDPQVGHAASPKPAQSDKVRTEKTGVHGLSESV